MSFLFRIAIALLCCCCCRAVAAQDTISPFQLLLQLPEDVVYKLDIDLSAIRKNRFSREWHDGALVVLSGDSTLHRFDIQVQVRGKMRRQTCTYPPLKIRFLPLPPPAPMLTLQEIKLVWSCKDTPENDQLVLKEAMMYELYNILTDQSYRIRHVTLTVTDRSQWGWEDTGPAFFIEPDAEMAARLNGAPYKPKVMPVNELQAAPYDRLCIFQFMIGNTDWKVQNSHNVRMVALRDGGLPLAVPYDFDYAGAVGANYAAPGEGIPIKSVLERYYLGLCREEGAYQPTFDLFRQKREAIIRRCEKFPGLTRRSRNEVVYYLQSFFEILDHPKRAQRVVAERCGR
jgi:hypothetical protein